MKRWETTTDHGSAYVWLPDELSEDDKRELAEWFALLLKSALAGAVPSHAPSEEQK